MGAQAPPDTPNTPSEPIKLERLLATVTKWPFLVNYLGTVVMVHTSPGREMLRAMVEQAASPQLTEGYNQFIRSVSVRKTLLTGGVIWLPWSYYVHTREKKVKAFDQHVLALRPPRREEDEWQQQQPPSPLPGHIDDYTSAIYEESWSEDTSSSSVPRAAQPSSPPGTVDVPPAPETVGQRFQRRYAGLGYGPLACGLGIMAATAFRFKRVPNEPGVWQGTLRPRRILQTVILGVPAFAMMRHCKNANLVSQR